MATLRHVGTAGLALSLLLLLLVDVQAFLLPSARPRTTRGKQSTTQTQTLPSYLHPCSSYLTC